MDQLLKKRTGRLQGDEEEGKVEDEEVLAKERERDERGKQQELEKKRKAILNTRREEYIGRQKICEKMKVKSFYVIMNFFDTNNSLDELLSQSIAENDVRVNAEMPPFNKRGNNNINLIFGFSGLDCFALRLRGCCLGWLGPASKS